MLFALFVVCAAPGSGALAKTAAPSNGIAVTAPTQVKRGAVYDVSVSGFSRRRAKAYLFIDYQGCAKSLSAEQSRAAGESAIYSVKGLFGQTTGWMSSQVGTDHACAYLVSNAGSVLATAKRSYSVRRRLRGVA